MSNTVISAGESEDQPKNETISPKTTQDKCLGAIGSEYKEETSKHFNNDDAQMSTDQNVQAKICQENSGSLILPYEILTEEDTCEMKEENLYELSPLPDEVRMPSNFDQKVVSWYATTFSSELNEVREASSRAKAVRSSFGGSPLTSLGSGSEIGDVENNIKHMCEDFAGPSTSFSSLNSAKTEISLLQANQCAENAIAEKVLLTARLICIGELEELRMKLAAFELDHALEKASYDEIKMLEKAKIRRVPQWDNDINHIECWSCKSSFSLLNRRHHCRRCGHIFCSSCAPVNNKQPIPALGFDNPVRQCLTCLPLPGDVGSSKILDNLSKSQSNNIGVSFRQPVIAKSSLKLPATIDAIRCGETNCLRNPSSQSIISTLQNYALAIEKVERSEFLGGQFINLLIIRMPFSPGNNHV